MKKLRFLNILLMIAIVISCFAIPIAATEGNPDDQTGLYIYNPYDPNKSVPYDKSIQPDTFKKLGLPRPPGTGHTDGETVLIDRRTPEDKLVWFVLARQEICTVYKGQTTELETPVHLTGYAKVLPLGDAYIFGRVIAEMNHISLSITANIGDEFSGPSNESIYNAYAYELVIYGKSGVYEAYVDIANGDQDCIVGEYVEPVYAAIRRYPR